MLRAEGEDRPVFKPAYPSGLSVLEQDVQQHIKSLGLISDSAPTVGGGM